VTSVGRLAILVATLLLVMVAPASAATPSLEEACREALGLRAPCVGAGKLGERAAAECRRLGIASDESCWARVGRRVVQSEIAAYEDSAVHRTLAFQYALGNDVPLRDAPWVGTHNSFNAASEDPTLSHTDSNQQLGLTDQLRLDVRSLELDVHWLPSPRAGGAFAPVLCHGQGAAGCSTERLLGDHLTELRTWLDGHRDQVLLLYLEDQIDDRAGYDASAKVVQDRLGSRLYRPREAGCNQLPLDLTRADVLEAGAQVLVVSDCGAGGWPGVAHSWPSGTVRFESGPRDYGGYPTCGAPGVARSPAPIVRYFEDSTFVAAATRPAGASSADDGLTPATVREMVRCGVDLFGFDQLLPLDGRLPALAWSWAPGQPRAADGGCVLQGADARWTSARCAAKRRPACLSASGRWTVPRKPVAYRRAARACGRLGLRFITPRTGAPNQALRDAASTSAVWLRLRTPGSKAPRGKRR